MLNRLRPSGSAFAFAFAQSLGLTLALVTEAAVAAPVEFTGQELQAAYQLIRPETTELRLDGRKATFEPAPALRYLGVEPQTFDIDLNAIADLVDLRFDGLIARMPSVRFGADSLEIEIPFADRAKAIRSSVGSVDLRGVAITAVLHWREMPGGNRELRLKSTRFRGTIRGRGLLALAEGKVKSLALRTLAERLEEALKKPALQDQILQGLSQWAKLTLGDRDAQADATTLAFFGGRAKDGSPGGVRFESIR